MISSQTNTKTPKLNSITIPLHLLAISIVYIHIDGKAKTANQLVRVYELQAATFIQISLLLNSVGLFYANKWFHIIVVLFSTILAFLSEIMLCSESQISSEATTWQSWIQILGCVTLAPCVVLNLITIKKLNNTPRYNYKIDLGNQTVRFFIYFSICLHVLALGFILPTVVFESENQLGKLTLSVLCTVSVCISLIANTITLFYSDIAYFGCVALSSFLSFTLILANAVFLMNKAIVSIQSEKPVWATLILIPANLAIAVSVGFNLLLMLNKCYIISGFNGLDDFKEDEDENNIGPIHIL